MIACVIFFLGGICCFSLLPEIPPPHYNFFFFFISIVSLLSCFSAKLRYWKIQWFSAFFIGVLWISLNASWQSQRILPKALENNSITVIGTVASLSENLFEGTRFDFLVEKTLPEYFWPHPGLIRLKYHQTNENIPLESGEQLKIKVKIKRPHGYANKGSFDKERYYFANRISAEGFVVQEKVEEHFEPSLVRLQRDTVPFSLNFIIEAVQKYRSKIHISIFSYLSHSPFAGVLSALVLGSRDGITPEQWTIFRDTGTAHLMAISGLHIGLVAALGFGLVRILYHLLPAVCFLIPAQRVAAFFAVLFAFLYAWLAGFSIPTQRALIMISVFMMGIICNRKFNPWRCYFLALGLVLLFDPLGILLPGFWLSFSAVGILMYGMQSRISSSNLGLWWKWGRAQWVIFLGLIPISLAAFQQTSMVAPFANIIAIPWVSFSVVPCALLGGILLPLFPNLGQFFLVLAESSFKILWPILEQCIKIIPKATWTKATAGPFELWMAFVGVLLLLAPRGFPARKLGIIFLLPLCLNKIPLLDDDTARLTLLDVGQGLSAVIETRNHVLLFDTGPGAKEISKESSGYNTGQSVVLPFFKNIGRQKADTIIISHGDNDHIGGLNSILNEMPVKTILTSEPEKVKEIANRNKSLFVKKKLIKQGGSIENKGIPADETLEIKTCKAGQKWTWDGVDFEMLHPDATELRKRNDHSCVLHVQAGEQSILLTGDIEVSAEKLLLERVRKKIKSTLLIVPHHGSASSSSSEFIAAVDPIYALIPVGYKNAYGHPKYEILERYRKLGVKLMDTANEGSLSFVIKKNDTLSSPISYRKSNKKIWQEP